MKINRWLRFGFAVLGGFVLGVAAVSYWLPTHPMLNVFGLNLYPGRVLVLGIVGAFLTTLGAPFWYWPTSPPTSHR